MTTSRRRLIAAMVFAAGVAGLFWLVPPFRVLPLGAAKPRAAFEPAAYVERFWAGRLVPAAARAADAATLTAAVAQDRQAARRAYGRSMALGGAYCYFVGGSGRIVSVERNSVVLAVGEREPRHKVALETGAIFGNALRDGTGMLDVNEFANSQDFNALSTELNRRVERDVLPALRERAAVGVTVRFAGCAEIIDEDADLSPLRVVPFIVDFEPEKP